MLCLTTKRIRFQDFDLNWVDIPADTQIYVDIAEAIAFYNDMHFAISKDEYTPMS